MNEQSTHAAQVVAAAGSMAQYDEHACNILSNDQIMAYILKHLIEDLNALTVQEIVPLLRNITKGVPVDPGLTNAAIKGESLENKIQNEGTTKFDAVAGLYIPAIISDFPQECIVDVEAQKTFNPGYDITTRGIYYACRSVGSQMGRDFFASKGDKYDAIKKVYSIWICFNTKPEIANTISRYRITQESMYGEFDDNSRYDIIEVIQVRLPKESEQHKAVNKPSELHSFLTALFSKGLDFEQKIDKMKKSGIVTSEELTGEVEKMCNISGAIFEDAYEQGIKQGIEQGIANMLRIGRKPDDIAEFCGYPIDLVHQVMEQIKSEK